MVVAIWKIAITIVDGDRGKIINAQQVTEKGGFGVEDTTITSGCGEIVAEVQVSQLSSDGSMMKNHPSIAIDLDTVL